MKKIWAAFLLLVCTNAFAQKKTNRHTPVITKGIYVSVNPYSIIEPEQGAVGLGIGYRFDKRIELHLQADYLYKGILASSDFQDLHGFRAVLSGKYFYQNKYGFFVGAEIKLKQYTFVDNTTISNDQLHDTIGNFQYNPQHTLIGGGVFWGKRFKLTKNGKFELEGQIGIGVKHRHIERKNLPPGYSKLEYYYKDRIGFYPDHDEEYTLPYLPAGVKLILHL